MDKQKSAGVAVISSIEVVIGAIGLFLSVVATGLNLLLFEPPEGGYSREAWWNGILAGIIAGVIFGIIFVTGRLTAKLRPLGRVLNLLIFVFVILAYLIFFYLSRFDFKENLRIFSYSLGFSCIFFTPLILSIVFIYFFNHPNVKEQFRQIS
ncbi:MAG: hypothetical protein ABIA66_03425 [Candidatus Omnitrophota bacterium]